MKRFQIINIIMFEFFTFNDIFIYFPLKFNLNTDESDLYWNSENK